MSRDLTTSRPMFPGMRRGFGRELMDEMEDWMARFWRDQGDDLLADTSVPTMDLAETAGAIEAKIDLPGVDAKDIEVRLRGDVMTVSAERAEEQVEKGKTFHRIERRTSGFRRSVTLPCPVDDSKVDAKYHDGVLTVILPKTEHAKTHKITVKS